MRDHHEIVKLLAKLRNVLKNPSETKTNPNFFLKKKPAWTWTLNYQESAQPEGDSVSNA